MPVLNPVLPLDRKFLTRQEAAYFHPRDNLTPQGHGDEVLSVHVHTEGIPREGLSHAPVLLKKRSSARS